MWLRLVPTTKGEPWFSWYARWLQVGTNPASGEPIKRQIISNSRNGEENIPCVLYYYAVTEENEKLLADEQVAITAVDLAEYHVIPRMGKNNKSYPSYKRCKGRGRAGSPGCQMCATGIEKVFGQQAYWSLYPSAARDVLDQLADLGSRCMNCRTGTLLPFAYKCVSCGESFANMYEAEIPADIEDRLRTQDATCKSCGHVGRAEKVMECAHRHRNGSEVTYSEGCDKPTPFQGEVDPYAVDIKVVFETVGKTRSIRIEDFRPCVELPPEMLRPMDLPNFLGKMSLAEQAETMKKPNPFGPKEQALLDAFNPLSADAEDHDSTPWDTGAAGDDDDDLVDDDDDLVDDDDDVSAY